MKRKAIRNEDMSPHVRLECPTAPQTQECCIQFFILQAGEELEDVNDQTQTDPSLDESVLDIAMGLTVKAGKRKLISTRLVSS